MGWRHVTHDTHIISVSVWPIPLIQQHAKLTNQTKKPYKIRIQGRAGCGEHASRSPMNIGAWSGEVVQNRKATDGTDRCGMPSTADVVCFLAAVSLESHFCSQR